MTATEKQTGGSRAASAGGGTIMSMCALCMAQKPTALMTSWVDKRVGCLIPTCTYSVYQSTPGEHVIDIGSPVVSHVYAHITGIEPHESYVMAACNHL